MKVTTRVTLKPSKPAKAARVKLCPCCGQVLEMRASFTREDLEIDLTPRQTEVIRMIAQGNTAQQSADTLEVSRRTIEFHRAMIMQRLRIKTTAELTLYAATRGLLK